MTAQVDRRALSHMAPDVRWVHVRLEQWARWGREKAPNGWPASTLLGRLIKEQDAMFARAFNSNELPEAIAETEAAVCHLGPEDRRVIGTYYLTYAPREFMARKCGMSLRRFDAVLNRARWRICGYLSAKGLIT